MVNLRHPRAGQQIQVVGLIIFATFTLTICFRDFVRQTSFQYFILLYLPRPHEISPVPGRGCSSFCRLFDTLGCDYCARSKV